MEYLPQIKGEDTRYFPIEKCEVVDFRSSASAPEEIRSLFNLLFRVLTANYTLGNFIYISQVLSLILTEIYHREKHNTAMEQNRHVTRVIRYMNKNLEKALTLDDLSNHFELSKSYLHAIFQKYTGHAPMDFFTRLKLQRACSLLLGTEQYVYEIAQSLGFTDQYYFSRIFKKITGLSPKEYRNNDSLQDTQK